LTHPRRAIGTGQSQESAMSARVRTVRWCLTLAVLLGCAAAVLAVWLRRERAPLVELEQAFPLPPYSATPYLNTTDEAHYLGSAACAECHQGRHASYLLTTHSRALADIDLAVEPPDAAFKHKRSGRRFRVYRQDGQLRHEEIVQKSDGTPVAHVDVPVRYVIGSGQFTRSYLVDIDGFLHESPITWYTSRKQWGVSPGYDAPAHWGFERPADGGCLVCHAGRFTRGATLHRITFTEKAIGCESCHGPGSLHVDRRRSSAHAAGTQDFTIVNPAKLSRPLQEAICATCHRNGPAAIRLRGRQLDDFRPGMPLTDHRIDYHFDSAGDRMTVVGHFEQLRRSACYQKSAQLSCLTCHDPHARQKPADSVAFYRRKCLDCHAPDACRLEPARRKKQNAADNCVACHMPRGDTEIPHIAFTHHRIGRHGPASAAAEPTRAPALVPVEDVSHLPSIDRQRSLGLAYLAASQEPMYAAHAETFRQRARQQLEAVSNAGLHDGDIATALAETYWGREPERVRAHAQAAVDAAGVPVEMRTRALFMLASTEMQSGDYATATTHFEELVRLRRYADDWRLLGFCYFQQGQTPRARTALEQALAIRPYRHTTHQALAEVFRRQGDVRVADGHLAKARWLVEHRQD
jgi:Flp pilus assembly protein TadD